MTESDQNTADESGSQGAREEVKHARFFFTQLDRLSTVVDGYPPGHPMIEKARNRAYDALYEYFELLERLTVKIDAHSMMLPGSDKVVWETESPKDFCFALTRGGIYLLHILPGVEGPQIQKFTRILNTLTKGDPRKRDPNRLIFDADFKYISYEALDTSMAQLSGLEVDIEDRDTQEEKEQIEELLDQAVNRSAMDDEETMGMSEEQYDVEMELGEEQKKQLQVGAREFLDIPEKYRKKLDALKSSLTRHDELEYREVDMLSAMLSTTSSAELQQECIEQMGALMEQLLDSEEPWEAYPFMRLIHQWRKKFDERIIQALQKQIHGKFSRNRIQELIGHIVQMDKDPNLN